MASERSAKYRQEIQQIHEFVWRLYICRKMIYDVRKAKGKAPPPPTILRVSRHHPENALPSNSQRKSSNIPTITSPTVATSRSSEEHNKMGSLSEHADHFTATGNKKSKIVVLKVGDALSTIGRDVSMPSVFEDTPSKVVTMRVRAEKLAEISQQKSHIQVLPTLPSLINIGAGENVARTPDGRLNRSFMAVSEAGSPLRRGSATSVLKLDRGRLTVFSNRKVKSISDPQNLAEDMHASPADQLSLEQDFSPPFHDVMSLSTFREKISSTNLNQQIGLSPPDWQGRQLQFQQELSLPSNIQQQGSSSQVDRRKQDMRVSWPTGSTPLKDLNHPLGSQYAPLPYNLPSSYVPSYHAASANALRLLPDTKSATFATEGWNQNLNVGESDLSASTITKADPDDFETVEEFKERLMFVLQQMMFVSGETAEASPETTGMIEEIVRAQVIEMLRQASELANRRGVRSISTADLIFLIRHDKAKVSRLKTFLSWKDVRKNVKDSDEKGGGDAGEVDFDDGANLPGAGPVDSKKSSNKKAKLILPWEVQSFYSEQVPERDDEEDNEEEEEQNEATLARLASADERTKNMTRDEYVYWSDCRQASFTFRKGKRFREWAGFGVVTDSKPNDDIVDILGFLTFEIVQTLTEEALKVKGAEDMHNARTSSAAGGEAKKRKREGSSLFEMPEEGRTPVEPKHVREAFRRLQIIPKKYSFMRQGYAGMRNPLRLI